MECTDTKVTTTISLDPALRERLDRSAAALDRSRSWLVARALAAFLEPLGDDDSSGAVANSFVDGLKRGPRMSNDAEIKAAQARALAQALAADAACRAAAQQSPATRVPAPEDK